MMEDKVNRSCNGSHLYKELYGVEPEVTALPGAGSNRKYFRLHRSGFPTLISTWGEDTVENRAFVDLSRAFADNGVNVPRVFAVSDDYSCYVQQDLGDCQLLPLLGSDQRYDLSAKTLKALVELQTQDETEWLPAVAYSPFSKRQIGWDLNYFKYEFLKPTGILFDENALEDDFEKLADDLMNGNRNLWGFMFRDCQSRNVMILDGEPWWIDFQGGRKGPLVYDVVSFLWQSKAGFSEAERKNLLNVYAGALGGKRGVDTDVILGEVGKMALFRTLQVLGAYGFRGLVERKSHFIESIPGAISNLKELYEKGEIDSYPTLKDVSCKIISSRFAGKEMQAKGKLVVKVFSFSYKKGYPEDLSGNGGGFMFDCRGMHNPGRYDEYKPLTGLDKEVIGFLEERGEVQEFTRKAVDMVSPSVECYLRRGFSSLQVGFGCTGGRHRSVYCAERFAKELADRYPDARIEIVHREHDICKRYNWD